MTSTDSKNLQSAIRYLPTLSTVVNILLPRTSNEILLNSVKLYINIEFFEEYPVNL